MLEPREPKYQWGQRVTAAIDLFNDGSHPEVPESELIVAAGTPGFLVIGFQGFRQIEVSDKAHVGLVDAHAEGDGRHHDQPFHVEKALLVVGA